MKKIMILALTAIMMAAGTVNVNAQEKVVTLDQLLKSQQQKQTQTPQKQEQKATTQTQTKQPKEKAQKQPKAQSGFAALTAPVDFNTIYLQYNFESSKYSHNGHSTSESANSISGGFNHAFSLSSTLPIYLEAGIAAKYAWKNKNGIKVNLFSLKVPVNLVYSFPVSDAFNIEPYAGIYLRGNIFGKEKIDHDAYTVEEDWDDDDDWYDDDDDWGELVDDWSNARAMSSGSSFKVKDSYDLFSKDDMGDDAWKRFGFGMQVGVRARINKQFLVGFGYTQELTDIADHTKFNSFDITLGYCF